MADDGIIVGLDDSDFTMQQCFNAIRDGIRPDVTIFIKTELRYEDELQ